MLRYCDGIKRRKQQTKKPRKTLEAIIKKSHSILYWLWRLSELLLYLFEQWHPSSRLSLCGSHLVFVFCLFFQRHHIQSLLLCTRLLTIKVLYYINKYSCIYSPKEYIKRAENNNADSPRVQLNLPFVCADSAVPRVVPRLFSRWSKQNVERNKKRVGSMCVPPRHLAKNKTTV